MFLLIVASVTAGLFAGAAIYITLVEHPARVSCGTELAVKVFAPSYRRATIMQASLAVAGTFSGLLAGWRKGDLTTVCAALLLGAVVPFTLIVIFPTNRRLLDPTLDSRSLEAAALLRRWGRLHGVRSLLAGAAFAVFVLQLAHLRTG